MVNLKKKKNKGIKKYNFLSILPSCEYTFAFVIPVCQGLCLLSLPQKAILQGHLFFTLPVVQLTSHEIL